MHSSATRAAHMQSGPLAMEVSLAGAPASLQAVRHRQGRAGSTPGSGVHRAACRRHPKWAASALTSRGAGVSVAAAGDDAHWASLPQVTAGAFLVASRP